jgi:hypothetical protein
MIGIGAMTDAIGKNCEKVIDLRELFGKRWFFGVFLGLRDNCGKTTIGIS